MRNVALRLINTLLKSLAGLQSLPHYPQLLSVQDYFILNMHFKPQIILVW